MADQMKLYLFGDQTYDVQPSLKNLLRSRSNPVLEDFLTKAYDALRTEIFRLAPDVRDDLPRFTCLDDVLLKRHDGKRCIPLDMALTTMYQLGVFISQAEASHHSADRTRVLGLCTGALAAAAVSCSRDTLELVPMAVDAVVVAFRTGMCVTEAAQRLEPVAEAKAGAEAEWSIVVPHLNSSKVVQQFCDQTKIPLMARPYVSAFTPNGITVSGSPRSLARLCELDDFAKLTSKRIAIYAPYHAPHLYSSEDVDEILDCLAGRERERERERAQQIKVLSSAGPPQQGGTFRHLLKAAVEQILLQPIRWDRILEAIQIWLKEATEATEAGAASFSVTAIGSKADQVIYTALKQTSLRSLLPTAAKAKTPALEDHGSYASPNKAKLAIIAMSGRFPGAKDNDAFWHVLHRGLDMHKPVPGLHWDANTHVDLSGSKKNTSATPYGCWLDDPAGFDARFFNISPREAPQIDPAQRLALMTAYEAIEQAGIVPDATPSTRRDRVGVFYGVTSNDWMETNSAQAIDTYFIPGGNRAFIPGRINYCFKFSGPSYAVDTACSSSLAGIHLACNSLWRGDIDTAIAGGTNVLTNPDFTAGLDKGHFLSRTGNCKTFDDSADGYCRGEGIGTIIMKRLDDAIADHDPILGVILGAYTNHSAESESITRPHVGAQRAIFSKILNQAGVDPYTVSYVEMHGTGTQAGDAGEMSSVLDTFAPPLGQVARGRKEEESLYLGSAKANIGHGEAASGVSSLIKVLMMMRKDTIVPHCGIKTKINHKFPTDLDERRVKIALQPTRWERSSDPSRPRRVFVNNFSAAGGNTAILLEDAPLPDRLAPVPVDGRSHQLVAVSAKNAVSLQGNLVALLAALRRDPTLSLGKLSYTTTARRVHHQHRVMLLSTSVEDVCKQIDTALRDQTGLTRPKSTPKLLFTFTGQGAQYPGMGKQLYETFSLFAREMRRLDRIGQSLGFPSVLPVVRSEEQDIGLFEPAAVQLASVCLQMALTKLWASWKVTPTAVVGHSLGEYAALNAAGVLTDTDTIYLVGQRATLLQQECRVGTHAMLVVKASVPQITAALAGASYEIACINSPVETVLAGPTEHISGLEKALAEAGIKSIFLKVPYAFHSSQVETIVTKFRDVILDADLTFSPAKVPVLCPLDGSIVRAGERGDFGAEYLVRHSREAVDMQKSLLEAKKQGVITDWTTTLEIGPHPAVSGMVKAVLGAHVSTLSSCQRGRPALQVLATTLKTLYAAGADVDWAEYQRDFKASHEVLALPAYSWDLKPYWIQYVNDWSLRKGDPPLVLEPKAASRLGSTTIHRLVEETSDEQGAHLVVEADMARRDLCPLVQGHEVDGLPLCTPSVYCDMALTLGTYVLDRYRPAQQDRLVDVSDMTISKALILREGVPQHLLQAHAEADWSKNTVAIKFMSFDTKGKLQEHARCVVRFRDRSLQQKQQKEVAATKRKMQVLRDGIATGVSARFNRPMVYRAIRPLARFHDDYRAIDEIVLDSKTLEASSLLSFGSVKRGGDYHTHPAVIDSLTQACSFAMNCNDGTDLDVEVFMNHGWGSFQIYEPLDFDKVYSTYTRMAEGSDKLWHGDVVVLDGDQVVAHFGSIAIQGVPRRFLKVILAIEGGRKTQQAPQKKQQQAPVAQPVAQPVARSVAQQAAQHVTRQAATAPDSKVAQAMDIVAEESGIALADLTEATNFGDVGIDSLLGLTITARFKEELDVDLDFNSLFYEYPTVGDLKGLIGGGGGIVADVADVPATGSSSRDRSPSAGSSDGESQPSGVTTPTSEPGAATPRTKVDFRRALEIVSEESGVAMEDLDDDTNFTDSGVDSLLSLVIVSRLRDELELDIQHESLFLECPTVADLRKMLTGSVEEPAAETEKTAGTDSSTDSGADSGTGTGTGSGGSLQRTPEEDSALAARKKAVDEYLQKYLAGYTIPVPSGSARADASISKDKVVLVTGASGSLGGNLVYHLAHLADVKTVVCLNRENKADAYVRQQKAMRDKGLRFPESLRPKLLVYQTDTAKRHFGLSDDEYNRLAGSVTHLIHNAWPMSAKRALPGFESQFQVMRNLIDFAGDAVVRRQAGFRFSFQMVSSVGVVGRYGLGNGQTRTMVPEERVGIESVLANGYGDAKWGCERMLDETLHGRPDLFRTMAVRLGQIAGSKTSGYWNPMEHFGFLIKSSQILGALPDVDGTVYWTPVNDIAAALSDLVLQTTYAPHPIYHIENPVGQPWKETNRILADALGIRQLIPFEDWVRRVRDAPQRNNPASTLLEFLDGNYLRMSCGGLVLDVQKAVAHSESLARVGPVSEEVVRKYIHVWQEIGFLN